MPLLTSDREGARTVDLTPQNRGRYRLSHGCRLWRSGVDAWRSRLSRNSGDLREMVAKGICGFKCFLIHSGVDEFPCVTYAQVEEALQQLSGTHSILLATVLALG
ncbi:hypothetical protein SK128_007991 [Halocaridina rubra]|uniref:Uncharacterized protein n=1 Tax=Halocaridina rubra TaxID=373956 RepID=A0AAN8WN82_HALRR